MRLTSLRNRLLQMIRTQQLQLEQMRQYQDPNVRSQNSTVPSTSNISSIGGVVDESILSPERSPSFSDFVPFPPALQTLPRSARRNSHRLTGSSATSPSIRPLPVNSRHEDSRSRQDSADWPPSPIERARRSSSRDESTYYQAETATLTRENQMLRQRIRDLERQVGEMNTTSGTSAAAPGSDINAAAGHGGSSEGVLRGGAAGEKSQGTH
jgi:hypothetical protein